MPIKQPSDLSQDTFVFFHEYRTQDGTVLEVSIKIHEKPSPSPNAEEKLLDDLRRAGVIAIAAEAISNRVSISKIKVATGDVTWSVLDSGAAEAGWGPFLYDIAIELATLAGAGLCSHESNVSEDALRLWNYYFSNRSDVAKTKLGPKEKPQRSEKCLQYSYRKSSAAIVNELKRLDKWIASCTVLDGISETAN